MGLSRREVMERRITKVCVSCGHSHSVGNRSAGRTVTGPGGAVSLVKAEALLALMDLGRRAITCEASPSRLNVAVAVQTGWGSCYARSCPGRLRQNLACCS